MKTISIFMLLIYWSIIIFAPFLSNTHKVNNDNRIERVFCGNKDHNIQCTQCGGGGDINYDYININGKMVSIFSKEGKNLLKTYVKQILK